jgi:hypothetical protein
MPTKMPALELTQTKPAGKTDDMIDGAKGWSEE